MNPILLHCLNFIGYDDSQWPTPLSKLSNAGNFASANIYSEAQRIWANSTANNVWCRHYIEKQSKSFIHLY